MNEHDLLGRNQDGFVKRKSCFTSLVGFFEGVNKQVDQGDPFDIVYLVFYQTS